MQADLTRLIEKNRLAFGDEGTAFIAQLPTLLAHYAARWSLTLLDPYPNLSYNYVAPALRADGTPVVFKVGVPRHELRTEIAALELYGGNGAVRLLATAPTDGVLLLERLAPGTMLSSLPDDEEATVIAASVMRQIWHPPPADHEYPTTQHWFRGLRELRDEFDGDTGPYSTRLVEEAERLAADLFATAAPSVVLHGDLHHFNILASARAPWLAIDPKGVLGEPAYEVGALMRNPFPAITSWANLLPLLERRLTILADELQLDRARLRAWTIAQGVLSAWWDYDPQQPAAVRQRPWYHLAETYAALRE